MSNYSTFPTADYERKELINYLMDSGYYEEEAKVMVKNLTDAQVATLYDQIPEEGEEE